MYPMLLHKEMYCDIDTKRYYKTLAKASAAD